MDAVYKKAGYREYLMSYAEYRNIPFMELDEKWEQYKEDLKRHSISYYTIHGIFQRQGDRKNQDTHGNA